MAEFLVANRRRLLLTAVLLLASVAIIVGSVSAGSVYSRLTGYAMGNQTGAFGVEVSLGNFANHPSWSSCYEGWPYNTKIVTPSVPMHLPNGYLAYFTTFYLRDRGDPSCSMPSYWVDLYFGRAKLSSDLCNCPGSPSPGYCINGNVNNCTDATNWGTHWWTYTYTFP